MRVIVGVIGGSSCTPESYSAAEDVGMRIAKGGALLICGGLSGVMEAACKGAKEAGGTAIGVLPGPEVNSANAFVTHPVATGMGYARNYIIIQTANVLIAIDGRYGTLTEIATALNLGKHVIGLGTWDLNKTGEVDPVLFQQVGSPSEAVSLALRLANQNG